MGGHFNANFKLREDRMLDDYFKIGYRRLYVMISSSCRICKTDLRFKSYINIYLKQVQGNDFIDKQIKCSKPNSPPLVC